MIREEGHYTIKRIDKLPKKGNANWLYILKSDKLDAFYRWKTNGYEEIKIKVTSHSADETTVDAIPVNYTANSQNVEEHLKGIDAVLAGAGGAILITQSAINYAALVTGIKIGDLAYVQNPQGTSWLPGTIGGSYYPTGFYLWDGVLWNSDREAISGQLHILTTMKTLTEDNLTVDRILDGNSVAIEQNPTGLGTTNAVRIEYGPAIGTVSDPVMLDSSGKVTINDSGTYRIKVAYQFGRIGNPGTSILLFRVTDGAGNQLGRSIGHLIGAEEETKYLENDTWLTVPAGTELLFEIMRDTAGVNFGGLTSTIPTIDGGNEWNFAPTASIRIERFIQG